MPLQDGNEFVRPHIASILCPLRFSELAFGRFARQFLDLRLKLRRGTETEYRLGLLRQDDPQHRANPPLKRVHFRCSLHTPALPQRGKAATYNDRIMRGQNH
jgi:hypothetical protein